MRDLTRAREDLKHLECQAKQRLQAFLLRHGKRYAGETKWTQMHFHWLETVKFDQPIQQIVFQEYVDTIQSLTKRVAALDEADRERRLRFRVRASHRRLDGPARHRTAHRDHHHGGDR